jgi:hypothetical protein
MILTGPKNSPLIQLLNWIFRPFDFLEECDRIERNMAIVERI